MTCRRIRTLFTLFVASLGLLLPISGCFMFHGVYSEAGGTGEAAVGEQHDMPFDAHDAYLYARDALESQGLVQESTPDQKIVTQWRDADNTPGIFGSIAGVHPQYRYVVEITPDTPRRSTIVVNVEAQDIPEDQLDKYKASTRIGLFQKIDALAQSNPPATGTPAEGGVNYAVLPGEDLRGLAKRVTGNVDNWQQIAQDNGLKAPTDTAGVKSVWVRNTMLKPVASGSTPEAKPQ
jgi:hypothetical protein